MLIAPQTFLAIDGCCRWYYAWYILQYSQLNIEPSSWHKPCLEWHRCFVRLLGVFVLKGDTSLSILNSHHSWSGQTVQPPVSTQNKSPIRLVRKTQCLKCISNGGGYLVWREVGSTQV
jgi:hypothetical protein